MKLSTSWIGIASLAASEGVGGVEIANAHARIRELERRLDSSRPPAPSRP